MKRLLALVTVFLLLVSAACAEDLTLIKNTDKNTIQMQKSYADNPVVEGISATTGLPASGEKFTPVMLVLDNAEAAYPHWGVGQADIIFQVPNAGAGATKLLALFADHYPEQAGGTRSLRASMVPLAKAWDAAIAYAGNPEPSSNHSNPSSLMSKLGMWKTKRPYNLMGAYAHRVDFVKRPHNSSCHILEIHENLLDNSVAFEQRPFLFTDEPRAEGEAASFVKVSHKGDDKKARANAASAATFTYREDLGAYIRTNSSGDYVDRDTGEVVPFANVIVLRVKFRWADGYVYLDNHLVGDGVAEIFQNGKYVRGAWFRESQDDRIVFVGPDGSELPMQRGKTFIVVTNDVTEVSYR
ncbi:MAG: DUF3048 domain-containing protein [Clostridiales bacterium]|nr:DUF3048 domain-containing protein [Clostridiales bacterium]